MKEADNQLSGEHENNPLSQRIKKIRRETTFKDKHFFDDWAFDKEAGVVDLNKIKKSENK